MCKYCKSGDNAFLFSKRFSFGVMGQESLAGYINGKLLVVEFGNNVRTIQKINFCPMCGRDLEVKNGTDNQDRRCF